MHMHLRNINITGFRTFARTSVTSLHEGLNCVVGPHGGGKSSFIEALLWLFHANSSTVGDPLFFSGTERQRRANRILVMAKLAGIPGLDEDALLSRNAFRLPEAQTPAIRETTIQNSVEIELTPEIRDRFHEIRDAAALQAVASGSPRGNIYVMDEIDGELSASALEQHIEALNDLKGNNQLILVTHRKSLMPLADQIIGVTMEDYKITRTVPMQMTSGQS